MGELGSIIFASILILSWVTFLVLITRFAWREDDNIGKIISIFLILITFGVVAMFTI